MFTVYFCVSFSASPSSAVYRPEFFAPFLRSTLPPVKPTVAETEEEEEEGYIPSSPATFRSSTRPPKRDSYRGKSSYPSPRQGFKSEHAPTAAVYADSADVEVFYPPEKAILPQLNGRPKPYDGYRAASDVEARVHGRQAGRSKPTPSAKPVYNRSPVEDRPTSYEKPVYHRRPTEVRPTPSGKPDYHRRPSEDRPPPSEKPVYHRRPTEDRRAQQFNYGEQPAETKNHRQQIREDSRNAPAEEIEEEEEDSEEIEEEPVDPNKRNSGFKYQYDSSVNVPDLVIKTYPYEKQIDNDEEFTHDYEHYKKSLPGDLEKHFGIPEYPTEQYTVAATENLENDKNCERVSRAKREDEEVSKTCYICKNPKTGGSYEQCAYQNEPTSKKYFYGGSTSSGTQKNPKPTTYRYKRSLDFFKPSSYEYFVYNDSPDLKRQARAETFFQPGSLISPTNKPREGRAETYFQTVTSKPRQARAETFFHSATLPASAKPPKRKTKKFKSASTKKYPKRKPRQQEFDPSGHIEGPPSSYNGPKYTYEGPSESYEGPKQSYEGPSSPYEGPSSPYEGPSSPYEGPDHDDYYDRTDDRIPYEGNSPLISSFFDDKQETQKRPRRKPKSEVEEFDTSSSYLSDYRFGPEFFDEEEIEDRPEPAKRNVFQRQTQSSNIEPIDSNDETFFSGNVKIFKNGDVCEKMKKDSMLCMVCNNDKTGAKYEQCQYSTKPSQKAYTYGSQKSFSSNKGENERPQRHIRADQFPDISDKIEKKYTITKMESKKTFNEDSGEPLVTGESRIRRYSIRKQRETDEENEGQSEDVEEVADGEDDSGKKRTETSERIEARDGIEDLDEFLGQQKGSVESNFPSDHESYEDYFKRVFPEFEVYGQVTSGNFDPFADLENFREEGLDDKSENISYEESESKENPTRLKEQKSSLPPQFFANDDESKKDLANAFASFQKRDWSKCKKMVKEKLVCYTCLNADGIKNEECMYVEGSDPVSSHMAYHEKKDYDPAASNIETQKRNATEPSRKDKKPQVGSSRSEEFVKGDFEGTEVNKKSPNKTEQSEKKHERPVKKRKQPIKKYGQEKKDNLDRAKKPNIDESIVKIYFNNTETTTEAA